MIKAKQLKGGLILSKFITYNVFYEKCSFSVAETQFSSLAEIGTKMKHQKPARYMQAL